MAHWIFIKTQKFRYSAKAILKLNTRENKKL